VKCSALHDNTQTQHSTARHSTVWCVLVWCMHAVCLATLLVCWGRVSFCTGCFVRHPTCSVCAPGTGVHAAWGCMLPGRRVRGTACGRAAPTAAQHSAKDT
jgi:hypothetical protein